MPCVSNPIGVAVSALSGPLSATHRDVAFHAGSSTCPLPGFRADTTNPSDSVQDGFFRLDRFHFLSADRYEKINSAVA